LEGRENIGSGILGGFWLLVGSAEEVTEAGGVRLSLARESVCIASRGFVISLGDGMGTEIEPDVELWRREGGICSPLAVKMASSSTVMLAQS
jgi:hypothetical protein